MLTNQLNLNPTDREYEKKVDNFAQTTIKQVESRSKIFGNTVNQIANSIGCENNIEENITNLNEIVKKLDPSRVNFTAKKNIFFNPTKSYFKKIKSEEGNVNIFLENLNKEKEILKRDNITLEIEIEHLEELINQINIEYEQGNDLKNELNEKLKELNEKNKEKYYIQNVIDPLEKKLFDIKQMAIVKEQSRLALEIIYRNNKEIIRNLERVQNVTIEALKTAIFVANSLHNQKAVLNKIQDLEAFDNFYQTISEAETQSKEKFPESENQIIELKKIEEV